MTYPYTRLTRPYRRAIMITLILLFFIISPIIILYTAGYRYDFDRNEIQLTGVLSIDVKPKDAAVFMNDVRIDQSLPIRLANRAPGSYTIRIEAEGKKTWERDITIHSKQTTYIRNITLFEDTSPSQIFNDPSEQIDLVSFSENGAYAIMVRREQSFYVGELFDIDTQTTTNLFQSAAIPTISWSPYNSFAAIIDGTTLTLVDADNSANATSYVVSNESSPAFQWNQSADTPSLFAVIDQTLLEFTLERERALQPMTSSIWYVDQDRAVWTWDQSNRALVHEETRLDVGETPSRIVHINQSRAITGANGYTTIVDRTGKHETVRVETTSSRPSPGTKEWLLWSPWELWTVYDDGNSELLNRTSDAVADILPLDQFGLLLLATETELLGFNPGYYITHTLLSTAAIQSVGVQEKDRRILLHGTVNGRHGIFSLEY